MARLSDGLRVVAKNKGREKEKLEKNEQMKNKNEKIKV